MLGKQGESHYSILEFALRISQTSVSQALPPPWSLPLSVKHPGWRERLHLNHILAQTILPSHHFHAILLAAKKAASNQHQYTGSTTCQKQKLDAHLTDRYSADAGVQESCGWVGTHFTHKGEFLFPADTVFLNFLSMRMQKKKSGLQIKVQNEINPDY